MESEVHCDMCGWVEGVDDLVFGIPEGFGEEEGDDPEALKELFLDPEYPSCCPECNHGVFRE